MTLLERETKSKILRFWLISHQMDLVIKAFTQNADVGSFYKKAHALLVHLRKQLNFRTDMESKNPGDKTRRLAFGELLSG